MQPARVLPARTEGVMLAHMEGAGSPNGVVCTVCRSDNVMSKSRNQLVAMAMGQSTS